MLPDLESLRCFVAAAELLNFRAAARQVALSPAALSQRIKSLEEQLDTVLFERTTRRVHMTAAGLALYPVAKQTIDTAIECLLSVHEQTGRFPIEITIGTRHELGLSWLVPMLPTLQEHHPGLTCHTYFGSGADLEDRIRVRQIDCAISSRSTQDSQLEHIRVHREDYVMVATAETLAENPICTVEDLKHHVLLDTHSGLPLFSYYRERLEASTSVNFRAYRHMGTIAAIRLAILQNQGIAVLPKYLITQDIESGLLIQIFPDAPINHDWFRLIFRKDDPRRTLFESIVNTMQSHPLK